MLRTANPLMADPDASRETNGASPRLRSPSASSASKTASTDLPPPDVSYAQESAHHYQAIQAALHHPHHLPPLAMAFPQAPPAMYPHPAQPSRRHRPGRPVGDHDTDGEGSGPEDSGDEYIPPADHPVPHGVPPLPDDPYSRTTQQSTLGGASQSQSFVETQTISGGESQALHGDPSSTHLSSRQKRGRRHENDEEWNRMRKDNHKEVERRRRGNINEGINQLSAIVPNSTGGEKAKGAVLTRAVQYIHQLKDNEARNIEKWTLEKLLMDQAMSDLTAQLEDAKHRWELEVQTRMALEREIEALKAKIGLPATSDTVILGTKRPRAD